MLPLLLLFVVFPAVEIWLLVKLSGEFGILTTVAIVLGTGVAGATLARWQGYQAIVRLQSQLRQGMLPAQAIGDGVLIFAAGMLLITPGLLSDITGLLLLIPPVRKLALRGLRYWLTTRVLIKARSFQAGAPGTRPQSTIVDAKVIDARVVDSESDRA